MYKHAVEGVQFRTTALFSLQRRRCSIHNGRGVQRRRHIHKTGNTAKPLRLALGACIIQAEYGYSDEEVALQIQERKALAKRGTSKPLCSKKRESSTATKASISDVGRSS